MWTRRLDAVFLHRIAGPLVFLLVVIGVFQTIFKGAKNADLAKELIMTLLDPVKFTPLAQQSAGQVFPAYKNLWTDDLIKADANFAE